MRKYKIDDNTILLEINKAPIVLRTFFFGLASVSFLLPIAGISISLGMGNGFHIGFLIALFIFGIIGFYFLRIALWNTYGKEIIKILPDQIAYEVDYGWFKDSRKSFKTQDLDFQINPIEKEMATLIIEREEEQINTSIKMTENDIAALIKDIRFLIESTNKEHAVS